MILTFPYGHGTQTLDIEDARLKGVLVSGIHDYRPEKEPEELVADALANPVGSPRLSELARDSRNIVLICSDHTRPVPSKVIVPQMLREIREGNPEAQITILISTGCHRPTTREELEYTIEVLKELLPTLRKYTRH